MKVYDCTACGKRVHAGETLFFLETPMNSPTCDDCFRKWEKIRVASRDALLSSFLGTTPHSTLPSLIEALVILGGLGGTDAYAHADGPVYVTGKFSDPDEETAKRLKQLHWSRGEGGTWKWDE